MRGIDISSHQEGLIPSTLDIDFCIVKGTEGVGYTNPYCDPAVQDCIANGILWGFYHFARENEPEAEAEYFYNMCKGYFGHGVPVLDYEVENYNNREWCERFLNKLHDLSGIWAMLYISASRTPQYDGSWIPQNCGLWLAGYPYDATRWAADDDCPYSPWPWGFIAIWQFTSSLRLNGWNEPLDGNIAYMDREAWGKYAGNSNSKVQEPTAPTNDKTCKELAKEVVQGKWGNGWNRKQALDAAYGKGTYDHVQDIVNRGDY